ncbi:mycothiol-dependent nitroreductase Rv2466c family protein [Nocardia anaemiae]|uniref:mycothiol-dependent nitroreductase Rv2466c family protein n=1 Tax=Nocardia anaemiae TaxID=263910 RepID=UPI0007A51423|nr:DsbA family protein [Nocardia anaemiae]
MSDKTHVDFFFDPFCPWAWITSRWIVEAQRVREFDVSFHVMSLAILNDGDLPPQLNDPRMLRKVWAPVRVAAAAEQTAGPQVLGPLYTAMGSRIHNGDNRSFGDLLTKDFDQIVEESLREVGLPGELAAAATSPEYDTALRRSTAEGTSVAGAIAGTPTMHIDGVAFFGPVLSRIPRGEQAGRLWDAATAFASYPDFWELKRAQPADLRPEVD